MSKGHSEGILKGAQEAVAYAQAVREGKPIPEGVRVHHFFTPEDIQAIREGLNMTQEAFASSFCLRIEDLRQWEEGASKPDTYARALLCIIARNPKAALEALHSA